MYFSLCIVVLSTICSLLFFTAEAPTAPAAAVLALSSTERQLLELTKKRAELEGNRSDVVRATEVLTHSIVSKHVIILHSFDAIVVVQMAHVLY